MEKPAFLVTMYRVVGRIEVEDQMLRRLGMRGNEMINEGSRDLDQGLSLYAILQAAKGWRRCKQQIVVRNATRGQLESRIAAQSLVVIEVLVAKSQGDDPLGDHALLVMDDEDGVSGIRNNLIDRLKQAGSFTNLPQ
jgi:hypothetical protein